MFFVDRSKMQMVSPENALPGRPDALPTAETHFLSGIPLKSAVPEGFEEALFGMGCFWGAERLFWRLPGVHVTAVGYAGGFTPNPTYDEVCSARTGHAEVVRVVYDPAVLAWDALLRVFWENHDPTQGMRQGNDVGTQYRSALYVADRERLRRAEASRDAYGRRLAERGLGVVTTEILDAPPFYFAEGCHQQYLARNPGGYCGLGGTGVACGPE